MRVAVVGAGGFIGRHLIEALTVRADEVVAISSKSADAFDQRTGILVDRPPSDRPIDALVYLAQSPHYREVPAQAPHLWGVNVVSAIKAAEWARRCGATCIIYASTGNVYEPSFSAHTEAGPVRRDDWYALSKAHAEEALWLMPDIRATSVRLFGVYGPGQRDKLIPNLARTIARDERIHLHGHPTDRDDRDGLRLSLTYVDDVVRALLQVIIGKAGPALNVAGPEVLSIRDIARTIGDRIGVPPVFTTDPEPRACDLVADNSMVSALVGGAFTAFSSGIIPTIDELRNCP